MGRQFIVNAKQGALIAGLLSKAVNTDHEPLTNGEKTSAMIIADAFLSIKEPTIVSFEKES
jgi:hypothetical protein